MSMQTSSSDIEHDETQMEIKTRKRKKGVRNTQFYKRNSIKNARLKGKEYVNHASKKIDQKSPNLEYSCCRNGCLESFTPGFKLELFGTFYNMESKNQQDLYLQGFMEIVPIKQKRARDVPDDKRKPKSVSVNYFLSKPEGFRKKVCLNSILNVFKVTKKRVTRILNFLKVNKSPVDLRGKHSSIIAKKPETLAKIQCHIESFPVKSSHYTGVSVNYLDVNLNVRKMYELFRKKYPEENLSYYFYWQYFKENFSLRFGRPAKDTCCTCEDLNIKIQSSQLCERAKRTAMAELTVHKKRSAKFYNAIKSTKECLKVDDDVLGLCLDYMATVSLPRIPVQDIYYYRQLNLNTFGIHNLRNCNMMCYVYDESDGAKGPNEVTTFLKDYLDSVGHHAKKLYLFSDNCGGQNKNHTLLRFLMYLVESKQFDEVKLHFPIRGHSFMPCDRDFGLIKRVLAKIDRLYTVDEYCDIILQKASKIKDRFKVRRVNAEEIIDFKGWWPEFYKKKVLSTDSFGENVPKEQKVYFSISKFHQFEIKRYEPHQVQCTPFINGFAMQSFNLRKTQVTLQEPHKKVYEGKLAITRMKMQDLQKTEKYIPEDRKTFWTKIFSLPTTDTERVDE